MKLFDPPNVIMRAERMMKGQIALFEKYFRDYHQVDSSYYFGNDEDYVKVCYDTNNKFLSKVYATKIIMRISGIHMAENWQARSQFLGAITTEGLVFKGVKQSNPAIINAINENLTLMSALYFQAKDADLINLRLDYNAWDKTLKIELNPYAGAFIWVKLPPIYHDVRLKENDVEKMHKILEMLREFFTVQYGMAVS